MSQNLWTDVDAYLVETLIGEDAVLDRVLAANAAAGLPSIDIAPAQGKLLYLLASACGAKRVLEVGTLGGYSTLWLARALPREGHLITLELDPAHAKVAQSNFHAAGLQERIELRLGPALRSLQQLRQAGAEPFDFIFIDADKQNNLAYLQMALHLSHPGTLIVVDNVVRKGAVIEADSRDDRVQGSRKLLEAMGSDPRLEATGLQTVGSKGHDGFVIARVVRTMDSA